MWYNKKDIKIKTPIYLDDLCGYVLPHAGTIFTGKIISHTLQFRPTKKFNKIIILYFPASPYPDINNKYYHEYYVPWQSLNTVFKNMGITYIGYNIRDKNLNIESIKREYDANNTLIIVSADFSHFLDFQEAINSENRAAYSIMFREFLSSPYKKVVDDMRTFEVLNKVISSNTTLQWVGRDMSIGKQAVGYLSFLLRETPNPTIKNPDGMFVTVFSKDMVARECLGEWFNNKKWSQKIENDLKFKVIHIGETTSRLTNGTNIEIPLTHFSITYLYKDSSHKFIRGWHGILYKAFYLPDVLLENTFNNGKWITQNDTKWQKGNSFNLAETFDKLNKKAGNKTRKNRKKYSRKANNQLFTLYSSSVIHHTI
jgi:hypothetical protein